MIRACLHRFIGKGRAKKMEGTQRNTDFSSQLLSKVLNNRQRTLTSEEFLSVSKEMGADSLDIFVRIPGNQNPQLIKISWKKEVAVSDVTVFSLSSLDDTVVEKILNTGSEFIFSIESDVINNVDYIGIGSVAAFPLTFQGAVIGCICFRSQKPNSFNTSNLSLAREFTTITSFIAHGEFVLSATQQANSGLIQWRRLNDVMKISEAIQGVADIMLDVISAAAYIIYFDVGFKAYTRTSVDSNEVNLIQNNLDEDLLSMIERLSKSMEILESDLLDVSDDENEKSIKVGKIYVIPSKDKYTILNSGSNYSLIHYFTTITTGGALNAVRDRFNFLNRKLAVNLNNEILANNSEWFDLIADTSKEASLLWAVATDVDENQQYGDPKWQEVVQACIKARSPLSDEIVNFIKLEDSILGNHQVLSIYLPITKARIWLGVAREGFGAELSTLSPWKVFLERLSEIADPALFRLKAQRLQLEAAETRTLATYVVTSQTVFHQISNMTRDIAQPIRSISEALTVSEVNGKEKLLNLVKLTDQSASALLQFASAIMNVNKLDTRRPCLLQEAVDEVISLFDLNLKSNQIHLQIENMTRDIKIDVPFNVVYSTLATLISNAKDAIGKRGGNIKINVEKAEDMIYCHVSNDGLPIEDKIREKLFKLGTTTKMGKSAGGWGLYLAYRSLIENRAYIELSNSELGETKFTMKFPYVR